MNKTRKAKYGALTPGVVVMVDCRVGVVSDRYLGEVSVKWYAYRGQDLCESEGYYPIGIFGGPGIDQIQLFSSTEDA